LPIFAGDHGGQVVDRRECAGGEVDESPTATPG
jgi:hypothetical protein